MRIKPTLLVASKPPGSTGQAYPPDHFSLKNLPSTYSAPIQTISLGGGGRQADRIGVDETVELA
jgi:hypothetical protein